MVSVLSAIARAVTGELSLPQHVCLFYPKEGYSVGEIGIDLILEENHSQNAEVTENPLQEGRSVADGIFVMLREGTLTALVSNHSLKHTYDLSKEEQTSEGLLSLAETIKNWKLQKNRAKQVWEDLLKLQRSKQLVKIVCALETYENVAITSLETSRDGETGDGLEIKIGFKQVQTVGISEHTIKMDMKNVEDRQAAFNANCGQVVAGAPSEADKKQLVGF